MKDWLEIIVSVVIVGVGLYFKFQEHQKKSEPGEEDVPATPNMRRPRRAAAHRAAFDGLFEEAGQSGSVRRERKAPEAVSVPLETASTADVAPEAEHSAADLNADAPEAADYAEFLRQHGREAVVLAEIILPPNSRAGGLLK